MIDDLQQIFFFIFSQKIKITMMTARMMMMMTKMTMLINV